MDGKLKSENMQKEQFYEWGWGVGGGDPLTKMHAL